MFGIFRFFLVFSFIVLSVSSPVFLTYAAESSSSTDDQDVQQMKEYVISDTRLPALQRDIYTVPAKITVITAEDIQKIGAKTVQEAMQYATGIVMYNEVGNAFEQRIDLRGFNSLPVPSISVFLDGMRVNEPNFNTVNFDLIPFEIIERIEIIPGPNAIFGKNALGGTINIITKTGSSQRQVTGEAAFGSFERERYNMNASGPIGDFNYFLNVTQEQETGFRDRSGGKVFRFFSKFGYKPSQNTDVNVSYTYNRNRLSQAGSIPIRIAEVNPEFNFKPGAGDFFERENNVVRVNATQTLPFGFTVSANGSYRNLQQGSRISSKPFFVGGGFFTLSTTGFTESWSGTVQLSQSASPFGFKNTAVVGFERASNDFESKNPFGFRIANEKVLGAYAQDSLYVLPNVIVSAGLRLDQTEIDFADRLAPAQNNFRDFDRVTPRAGVTFLVTPTSSVYFTYSQGFRVPTTDEMFAFGGGFTSNPNLAPVRSKNFEIGGKAQIGQLGDVSIALYQSNIRDEIFLTCILCDGSAFDGVNRNVDKTRRRGIEVTVRVRPVSYFDGTINYTFTEAQFRSMRNIGSGFSLPQIVDVGDSIPLVPKNRLSVIGNFYPHKGATLTLMGLYVSTQFLDNDQSNSRERLPGYFVLNGKASYQRPVPGGILKAFLQLNNMLDTEYATRGIYATDTITGGDGSTVKFVVPAPGINVFGGISYQFNTFPG